MYKIITHSGKFHPDEVTATSIIKIIFRLSNINVDVIRTRDKSIINNKQNNPLTTFIIDVGGVYDPDKNMFDHHQLNCNEFFNDNFDIPMSSVGMVYKKYGYDLISQIGTCLNMSLKNDIIEKIYVNFYERYILELDAIDNGILPDIEGGLSDKKRYNRNLYLSFIISLMNSNKKDSLEDQDTKFGQAVDMMIFIIELLMKQMIYDVTGCEEEYPYMEKLYNKTETNYIIIDKKLTTSWRKLINNIDTTYRVKFIIRNFDNDWSVQTTRSDKSQGYIPIILKDDASDELKPHINFVHKNQFCAGTDSCKSAIQLCKESTEHIKRNNTDFGAQEEHIITKLISKFTNLFNWF